jgi:hypothetical protein
MFLMFTFQMPRCIALVLRPGLLIMVWFLGSCRPQFLDTVDLELPSKLVVGCNLILEANPSLQNDSLFLKLNQSAPLFGLPANSDSGLAGATIRLIRQRPGTNPTPGDTLNAFGFEELRSLYGARIRLGNGTSFVQEGYSYQLSVRSADGRSVASSTVVPVWRVTDTTMQVLVQASPSTWTRSVQIRVQWRDLNGSTSSDEPAYYRVNYRITGNPWYQEDYWLNHHLGWYPNQLVNAGTAVNGLYTWQDRVDLSIMPGDTLPTNSRLEVAVQRISPELYRYLRGVGQQDAQDGNPFSEPAVIPSNITNGLGCFGSSVQIRMSKPLFW